MNLLGVMRNAPYLAAALLLAGCQSPSVPSENPSQNLPQSSSQTQTQVPQQPSRYNEVISYLSQLPRSDLEGFFDIDVYKGYHASFQGQQVSLTPVQDPFVVEYQQYADELSRGEIGNAGRVNNELRRMSQGRTYVGVWDGVRYRLSDADHQRPYLRVVKLIDDLRGELDRFASSHTRQSQEIVQLRDAQSRCDPSMLEPLEERIRSLEFQIAEPFAYSRPIDLKEQLDFFRQELMERYVEFPQAPRGGVRVVFEAYASRFRREDIRRRIGSKQELTILIENPRSAHFVFRVFSNGRMIDSAER